MGYSEGGSAVLLRGEGEVDAVVELLLGATIGDVTVVARHDVGVDTVRSRLSVASQAAMS